MKVLWKFCSRSLKENRTRTLVTILGVALATALITMVACMGTSFLASLREYFKSQKDWHACFEGVSSENVKYFQENQALEGVYIVKKKPHYGLAMQKLKAEGETEGKQEGNRGFLLEVCAPEKAFYEHESFELVEGRLPQAEGEIIIGKELRTENRVYLGIGDEITIQYGDELRPYDENETYGGTIDMLTKRLIVSEEKTYRIVGILRKKGESIIYQGFSSGEYPKAYIYEDAKDSLDCTYDIYVRYKKSALKHLDEVNAALLNTSVETYNRVFNPSMFQLMSTISQDEIESAMQRISGFELNGALTILEEPMLIRKNNQYALLGIVTLCTLTIVFLIMIFAGVFCINNSFDVSFTERIRLYGMLSSIGTTTRQKRRIVWMEAFVIGILGIPLGILSGILLTLGMIGATNQVLSILARKISFVMMFEISWLGIFVAAILAAFMVCLSAFESAVHASRITPMEAIRLNDVISSDKKKKRKKPQRTPKWIKKLFGAGGAIAFQNFRRSKLKYRATIVSIAVSVSLFIGVSFVGPIVERIKNASLEDMGSKWQIEVNVWHENGFYDLVQFLQVPGVTKASIRHNVVIRDLEDSIPYVEEPSSLNKGYVRLIILDEKSFENFCEKIGLDPGEVSDQGIVNASRTRKQKEKDGLHLIPERYASFDIGDTITGRGRTLQIPYDAEEAPRLEIKICAQTDEIPDMFLRYEDYIDVYLNEKAWLSKAKELGLLEIGFAEGHFMTENANALEDAILDADLSGCTIVNYDALFKIIDVTKALIEIFLAGFLAVITLIGVTNVINAVSTNVELRAPEFAKLKALGMTEKQLKMMLRLEGLMIGGKGVFWGLLIGYGICYAMERYFWEGFDKSYVFHFQVPLLPTILAILAVIAMLWGVLAMGRKRLEKKNLIETIRSENI